MSFNLFILGQIRAWTKEPYQPVVDRVKEVSKDNYPWAANIIHEDRSNMESVT